MGHGWSTSSRPPAPTGGLVPRHGYRTRLGSRGFAADDVGLFGRIDSLLVQELLDYTTYDSADMLFDIMGFGMAPDAPVPLADPVLAGSTFKASLMLVADGLGATIEDFAYDRGSRSRRSRST